MGTTNEFGTGNRRFAVLKLFIKIVDERGIEKWEWLTDWNGSGGKKAGRAERNSI